jgi:hypothetical protein
VQDSRRRAKEKQGDGRPERTRLIETRDRSDRRSLATESGHKCS